MISFSVLIVKHPSKADTGNIPKSKHTEKEMIRKIRTKNYIRSENTTNKTQNQFFRPCKEKGKHMEYQDFLELAVYGNEQWNGAFTQEEIKENAEIYFSDFQFSKRTGETTEIIMELLNLLEEDGEERASEWKTRIEKELNL